MKSKQLGTITIFLAFLIMGFGDVAGPLTSQLQEHFALSDEQAGYIGFFAFIMFGLSIPMGVYQDRKGRKYVLRLGLLSGLLGMILPMAGKYSSFALILGGLFFLGAGAALLQVAGNPIMRDVSPDGKYSRNLSFGQFVKAIGSLSGSLIPIFAYKFWGLDWKLLFPIYGSIIILVIIFLFFSKIEEKEEEVKKAPATLASSIKLLGNPFVASMVMGIFLYVGAEVAMSMKLPNYLELKFDFDIKSLGLLGTAFFFLALMIGRFLGGVILNWMSPKRFLIITALISVASIVGLYFAPDKISGFIFIVLIGLGFANIFPLIFSITIDAMPERANEISGLMVTAIIGAAVVPWIFGKVSSSFGLMTGFSVPLVCMLYIFLISFKPGKKQVSVFSQKTG